MPITTKTKKSNTRDNKIGADHTKLLNRIKRIEGQLRGISSMIENKKYCIDILNQTKAIKSAIKSVEVIILEKHLSTCFQDAFTKDSSKEIREQKIEEIIKVLSQVN
jgi:DNA-binding FrmR family transcriptional regulator